MQEIGESREQWGWNVWHQAEDIANSMKKEERPFYIVFAAKQDRAKPGAFRQCFHMYRQRPPKLLGVLTWYVDHKQGIFRLEPELSLPPDVPLDPSLLSKESTDVSGSVAEAGQKAGVLLS